MDDREARANVSASNVLVQAKRVREERVKILLAVTMEAI